MTALLQAQATEGAGVNTGQYISAGAHFGFIAYVLLGGFFLNARDSEPVQTQEVSLISESDFAALSRVETAPEVPVEAPEITAPAVDTAALSNPEQAAPATPEPVAPAEPSISTPAPAPVEPITPPAAVDPTPPSPTVEPEISTEDPGAGLPDIPNQRPTPRPVPRIAPEAVVNPERTPDIADQVIPEVSPEATATAEPVPDQPAAAPQEAVTEIVTEAEKPSGLSTSPRPKARPQAVVAQAAAKKAEAAAQATAQTNTQAAAQANSDAAANAAADAASALVAEATSETPAAPRRPTGPPMSAGEKDALRVAVQQCWNTGSMSTEAQRTKVTVGVSMNQDGTPIVGSIKLLGSSGGSSASAEQAFQTARRAIIICGRSGFQLPAEKYNEWRDIELSFDPEQMRFK
ncbi:energy transducer TonB [Pacificibacter marinus]|uniref:energy transducer TonB n=1 Tax=Pacificibacter marinus TaxID=658057 RepID=UPI001C07EC9C|nr:energy transducer TonB [Pacificibacter marinus]MBU2865595.1 energy transducer TonB [Pacificibacter marinus]